MLSTRSMTLLCSCLLLLLIFLLLLHDADPSLARVFFSFKVESIEFFDKVVTALLVFAFCTAILVIGLLLCRCPS